MKIAYITSRFPYPLEKGDKLRANQQIRLLHALGHEVHLFAVSDVPVSDEQRSRLQPFCKTITVYPISRLNILQNLVASILKGQSAQSRYFYNQGFKKLIHQSIVELDIDLAYFQLIRTAYYAEGIDSIPKVLDYQDAFSLGMQQRSVTASFFNKFIFKREARLLHCFERKCYSNFDAVSIISEADGKSLGFSSSDEIQIVPNGIDCTYFSCGKSDKKVDVLFVGNMGYNPNIEAAVYLVKKIMPSVWASMPDVKVMLAGANPGDQVRKLAGPNVEVTGWVEDIRSCYSQSRLFIAPMVSGTGLQNKILEAMAMGLPTFTTSICAQSLAYGHNEILQVHDRPDTIAAALVALLSNPDQMVGLGMKSREYILSNYDLSFLSSKLELLLHDAMNNFKKRKP